MKTRWKTIPRVPRYMISEYGDVRVAFSDKPVKQYLSVNGYKFFHTIQDGKRVNVYTHSTVARLFVKGRRAGYQVNHIDGNKQNNRVDNLKWVSAKANMKHAAKMGLCRKGPHKSDAAVQAMYAERDKYSQIQLAKRHGMSRTSVNMIINGHRRRWAIEEAKLFEKYL